MLHAGVSVVPAALAAAELKGDTTGADLLAGIAAGLELISRLGIGTTIGIIESGFIYTSLFGYFGATYGPGSLPDKPNVYKSKKGAQDAHEAIRPTSFDLPPEAVRAYLKDDEWKLYKLIWDRFVASQM